MKILCDTAHRIEREGAETLVFDKGVDSVDFALVNRVQPGDIVITQDYGLASMCLARRARVLNQNGLEYTAQNIDGLLARRHENKKLIRAGKHPKGPAKRTTNEVWKVEKLLHIDNYYDSKWSECAINIVLEKLFFKEIVILLVHVFC